jgi:hypothetical protein
MINSILRRMWHGTLGTQYRANIFPGTFLVLSAALAGSALLMAQSEDTAPSSPVPPPDPGYSLYYHDSVGNPDFADRWGYHDGWTEGRHDRNHGDTFNPEEKEHFKLPPEHGDHPGITRDQYVKNYRAAYLRGYQHGSRI